MREALIDRIYEAAGTPELWPEVLQSLGETANSDGAVLMVLPPVGMPRWIASPALEPHLGHQTAATSWRGGRRTAQWRAEAQAGFMRDIDLVSGSCDGWPCDIEKPFWQVGTTIPLPTGDVAIVTAERGVQTGPHEASILPRLDALRPHLVRACHLSARFNCERSHLTSMTLNQIGLPAAVLSASGRVLTMNARLQEREEVLPPGQHGGQLFRSPINSNLLQDAIGNVVGGRHAAQTMPVRSYSDHRPQIAHIMRLKRHPGDVFGASAVLLVLVHVGARAVPDDGLLNMLFNLTPAEARLLQALAGGLRLQSYAESVGVQKSTVRTQLTSIFNKTGTKRQAELLSIVASLALFSGQTTECLGAA
ncbi:helix-turn-helix transcriptional regulator [uncultured Methylobacterium sp.]|jgi:DNA-binding CsgD family transcriptional regulator|uniref:helix-turn-helix transcriptional regulator n=1 Tax=uncultured Methylobacterium sp. TaxID=157278 RepID=UPI00260161B0|nr:helix-turn-helix transcriptional regulator [uncultured Methylobacterium sp.]